ncbi:MAG: hypothetical protein ACI399_04425 [Candidatus Cryptobacteroides sp.]
MLYSISFSKSKKEYCAGSKVVDDLYDFLEEFGCKPVYTNYLNKPRPLRICSIPGTFLKLAFSFKKNSEVFFVYSDCLFHPTLRTMFAILRPLYRRRNIRLTAISFDINSIRFLENKATSDVYYLNVFDRVVLQSPEMERRVREGTDLKAQVLLNGLFDYKVRTPFTGRRTLSHDICFAGFLPKSAFLHKMDSIAPGKCRFLLYGMGYTEDLREQGFIYKGAFNPDDLSGVEGSWGLIWDGETADRLSGFLGEYLRFNSPHKASMYLCAGMPLIAPEGSFVGDVIRERGVGLVVKSIGDIDAAVDAVSEEDYSAMLRNVEEYAGLLKNGLVIKKVLGL